MFYVECFLISEIFAIGIAEVVIKFLFAFKKRFLHQSCSFTLVDRTPERGGEALSDLILLMM